MALKSGSLGTLLQGVSQQPDRVRLEGQVTEQVNMISDVTRGLSTRPATNEGPALQGGDGSYNYQDLSFKGDDIIIGYKEGDILVWGTDGSSIEVIPDYADAKDYIGDNMQFHVVDGQIVLLNREVVTRESDVINEPLYNLAMYHCLGGQFSKTYSVTLTFSNGYSQTESYTTPDGTGDGDADSTTAEAIVRNITQQFNSSGTLPDGTIGGAADSGDVARYIHPTMSITVTTTDGEAGEVLRGFSEEVSDTGDLPRFAPNGSIVKVATSEASEDDFWLKFVTVEDYAEDGTAGFGKEGSWTEWYNPRETYQFDTLTMPHVLVKENDTLVMRRGPWISRQVGDSDSAPFPSFVGGRIRDVGGFEGRLMFIGENSVVTSRTNEPFDFWRESATVVSATDPVDITSTKKDDLTLDWLVPFDRDMFVMSDPGDSQFVIRGGGISPDTVSMVLTTEFEISSGGTPPVSTGRTILFPFSTGSFSGVKEFYTDSDNAANAANSLTETQDRYIIGPVIGMAVSQNFNMGLFRTSERPRSVWVYKYLWDTDEVLQSAWSKWEFKDDVKHLFFRDSTVTLVGVSLTGTVFLHTLDLNSPEGQFGYHEMLDRRVERTVSGGFVDLPFRDARFLQYFGCENPGLETVATRSFRLNSSTYRYEFDQVEVPDGATLACGQTVQWTLTPSQVFARDYQNRLDTSRKVTIQDYVIHVDNSGEFSAKGTSPYSEDWEYNAFLFPLDNEPLDPDGLIIQTGPVFIPWGERADWSTLTLVGEDIRPVTILEIEWNGQILHTKGRRA